MSSETEQVAREVLFKKIADYLEDYSILRDGAGYRATIRMATELRNWPGNDTFEVNMTLRNAVTSLRAYANWLRPSKKEWRNDEDYILTNWHHFNKAFQQFQLEVAAIHTGEEEQR